MCCGKWKHKPREPDRERNTFGKEELGKAAQAAKPKVAQGAQPSAEPPTPLPASQGLSLSSASPVPSPDLPGSSVAGLWEHPLRCSADPGDTQGTPKAAGAVGVRGRDRRLGPERSGPPRGNSPAPAAAHGTCLPCQPPSSVTLERTQQAEAHCYRCRRRSPEVRGVWVGAHLPAERARGDAGNISGFQQGHPCNAQLCRGEPWQRERLKF